MWCKDKANMGAPPQETENQEQFVKPLKPWTQLKLSLKSQLSSKGRAEPYPTFIPSLHMVSEPWGRGGAGMTQGREFKCCF